MTCSPARLAANQLNAQKSSGPRTAEGKVRSRGNALKHGLTGAGVVVAEDDAAEVEALAAELEAELKPSGVVGRILLRRVAVLSNRLDRCGRNEAAMTAKRVRDAAKDRVNARRAEVDALVKGIADDPDEAVFRLKQTPEGIDWLLSAWTHVRGQLSGRRRPDWGRRNLAWINNLLGRTPEQCPPTSFDALVRAVWGDFSGLADDQGAGLTRAGRKSWACDQLMMLIDAEMERLRALRAEIDGENEAIDRDEAADRALFDPSKEAQLARKYEAAAERGLFRALREFQAVEGRPQAGARPAPVAPTRAVPPRKPDAASPPTPPPAILPAPAQTNPTRGGWTPVVDGSIPPYPPHAGSPNPA